MKIFMSLCTLLYMFKDRQEAGQLLAQKLISVIKDEDVVILGIPRGGVVVAKEVAARFKAPLDIVVVKKIGAPHNSELAIGAVGPEKTVFWDSTLCRHLGITASEKKALVSAKEKEREERESLLRGEKSPLPVKNKTVVLLDDGIATGATVIVAAKTLRKKHPSKLILAVPVVSYDILRFIEKYFDRVVILAIPEDFSAVGQFYKEFQQVSDEEVKKLLVY